jgi:hypothetical protein
MVPHHDEGKAGSEKAVINSRTPSFGHVYELTFLVRGLRRHVQAANNVKLATFVVMKRKMRVLTVSLLLDFTIGFSQD